MDLPTSGEEGSLQNGDRPGLPQGSNAGQNAVADAKNDDGSHEGENKFQRAISVWRGMNFKNAGCEQ